MPKAITYIDLFSGIGGFREGLSRAGGFVCVGHCEIDKYADQIKNMDEIEVEGEGLLARAICHECAHLDGQLYTELVEGELMDTENDEEEITEE